MANAGSAQNDARTISPEQAQRLARAHLDVRVANDPDPLAFVVRRLAGILEAKVVALIPRGNLWWLRAQSTADAPPFPIASSFPDLDLNALRAGGPLTARWVYQNVQWTLVGCLRAAPRCPARTPLLLAVAGQWTLPQPTLVSLAQSVSLSLAALDLGRRARQRVIVHRMSRLLANTTGLSGVGKVIVAQAARAVRARLVVLAVPDSSGRRLSIVACHGYPLALVEDLLIDAGVGVLGQVFERGRVMHVAAGGRPFGERQHRPRYRTDSFVAVPIRGGRGVVGVLSVTDRLDDMPFTPEDVSALRALVTPAALALERERAVTDAEAYAHAAAIDPVSGAFNRRYFRVRLDEELQRSRRHNMPVALLMIDIDDFKTINDAFGHLAGDTIIREVADILRRSVRVFDVCSRFGGEEFAIIMPGSGAESALKIAERIRQRIEAYRSQDPMLANSRITVSIGLTTSSPAMNGRDLVERADRALYMAKRAGKNQVKTLGPN